MSGSYCVPPGRTREAKGARWAMANERGNWIWNLLRRKNWSELDRLEAELVKRPGEKRKFAGDPQQPKHLVIPLKRNQ